VRYATQRLKAYEFEVWTIERLNARDGTQIRHLTSSHDQLTRGDALYPNGDVLEIKLDEKLLRTGNLYIPVGRKQSHQREYLDSGIFATASFTLYGIGDYRRFWIFRRVRLQALAEGRRLVRTDWASGYLLSEEEADQHGLSYYCWPAERSEPVYEIP